MNEMNIHIITALVIGLLVLGACSSSSSPPNAAALLQPRASNADDTFTLYLPEGWVEDTSFGVAVFESPSIAGENSALSVELWIGVPKGGGYMPNTSTIRIPVSSYARLEDQVENAIENAESRGRTVSGRQAVTVDGIEAEQFRVTYPDGFTTLKTMFIKGNHEWLITCAGDIDVYDEDLCADIIVSLDFN